MSYCQGIGLRGELHVDVYFPKQEVPNEPGRYFYPKEPYLNNPRDAGFDAFLRVGSKLR
jgi:hypothetical protein